MIGAREFSFIQRGQRYTLVRTEPHVRKDGAISKVAVLETECPECGITFEIKQSLFGTSYLTRRCKDHARPGNATRAIKETRNPEVHPK